MPTIYTNKPLPERHDKDEYITPADFCCAALTAVNELTVIGERPVIVDAGAGSGHWGIGALNIWPSATLCGVEIRKIKKPAGYHSWYSYKNYLKFSLLPRANIVIGNPPFSLAEEFIRHSIESVVSMGGMIVFLLPQHFSGSEKRGRGLFQETPPTTIITPMQRIHFENAGKNNPNLCDLYVWDLDLMYRAYETRHKWLDWKAK